MVDWSDSDSSSSTEGSPSLPSLLSIASNEESQTSDNIQLFDHQGSRTTTQRRKPRIRITHEIDYVGTGTFQLPQLSLFNSRAAEGVVKDTAAQLSARGLHHRSRERFEKEIITTTNTISTLVRGETALTSKGMLTFQARKLLDMMENQVAAITKLEQNPSKQLSLQSSLDINQNDNESHDNEKKSSNEHDLISKKLVLKLQPQLFSPYFQRAIAFERLGELKKAIHDYSVCLLIQPQHAASYFNRGRLYRAMGDYDRAASDFSRAILFDPNSPEYRRARAMLFREQGEYGEAVKDTIMTKSLQNVRDRANAAMIKRKKLLESQARRRFSSLSPNSTRPGTADSIPPTPNFDASYDDDDDEDDEVPTMVFGEDPVVTALQIPPNERNEEALEAIMDFLRTLKFFQAFVANYNVLTKIASKVKLGTYARDEVIFREKDPGNHFYMILDGQVDIVKVKKTDPNTGELAGTPGSISEDDPSCQEEVTVLVRMFRGQTFGETALESKGGRRTAGARAGQKAQLVELHVDEYLSILSQHRATLKDDVMASLRKCPVFTNWGTTDLEYLSSYAIIKHYSAGSTILKVGEVTPSLFLIKSGLVNIVKSIVIPDTQGVDSQFTTSEQWADEFKEVPGLWILQRGWTLESTEDAIQSATSEADEHNARVLAAELGLFPQNKFLQNAGLSSKYPMKRKATRKQAEFVVSVVGSDQVFGEFAILHPDKPSTVSAVASTSVELYCFDTEVLVSMDARYQPNAVTALTDSLRMNDPPSEKISFFFRQRYAWELKKSLMRNNTLPALAKQNEKQRKEKQLQKITSNDISRFLKSSK